MALNPRPHQRIRIQSPAPSQAVPPSTATVPLQPPTRVRPIFIDRLSAAAISSWQSHIRATASRLHPAGNARIKATSAKEIAAFVILALKFLALKEPVPTQDLQLGVETAKIDDIYSLFLPHPSFQT